MLTRETHWHQVYYLPSEPWFTVGLLACNDVRAGKPPSLALLGPATLKLALDGILLLQSCLHHLLSTGTLSAAQASG